MESVRSSHPCGRLLSLATIALRSLTIRTRAVYSLIRGAVVVMLMVEVKVWLDTWDLPHGDGCPGLECS
jgi:hypothetical protein